MGGCPPIPICGSAAIELAPLLADLAGYALGTSLVCSGLSGSTCTSRSDRDGSHHCSRSSTSCTSISAVGFSCCHGVLPSGVQRLTPAWVCLDFWDSQFLWAISPAQLAPLRHVPCGTFWLHVCVCRRACDLLPVCLAPGVELLAWCFTRGRLSARALRPLDSCLQNSVAELVFWFARFPSVSLAVSGTAPFTFRLACLDAPGPPYCE